MHKQRRHLLLSSIQLVRVPVDSDERIFLSICETPSPTPTESPPSTHTTASNQVLVVTSPSTATTAHIPVIASSVTAGVVVCLVIVIIATALIVTCKKHKKTVKKLK